MWLAHQEESPRSQTIVVKASDEEGGRAEPGYLTLARREKPVGNKLDLIIVVVHRTKETKVLHNHSNSF